MIGSVIPGTNNLISCGIKYATILITTLISKKKNVNKELIDFFVLSSVSDPARKGTNTETDTREETVTNTKSGTLNDA
jgi:hypothetical protein